jgi:hypothetical protein
MLLLPSPSHSAFGSFDYSDLFEATNEFTKPPMFFVSDAKHSAKSMFSNGLNAKSINYIVAKHDGHVDLISVSKSGSVKKLWRFTGKPF